MISAHCRPRTDALSHVTVCNVAKYRGVWFHDSGSNAVEIKARIRASWKNWVAHSSVLCNGDLPFRARRLFFQELINNTIVSALEALVLSDAKADKLTSFRVFLESQR